MNGECYIQKYAIYVYMCHITTVNANRSHACAEEQKGAYGVFEERKAQQGMLKLYYNLKNKEI